MPYRARAEIEIGAGTFVNSILDHDPSLIHVETLLTCDRREMDGMMIEDSMGSEPHRTA